MKMVYRKNTKIPININFLTIETEIKQKILNKNFSTYGVII